MFGRHEMKVLVVFNRWLSNIEGPGVDWKCKCPCQCLDATSLTNF